MAFINLNLILSGVRAGGKSLTPGYTLVGLGVRLLIAL